MLPNALAHQATLHNVPKQSRRRVTVELYPVKKPFLIFLPGDRAVLLCAETRHHQQQGRHQDADGFSGARTIYIVGIVGTIIVGTIIVGTIIVGTIYLTTYI